MVVKGQGLPLSPRPLREAPAPVIEGLRATSSHSDSVDPFLLNTMDLNVEDDFLEEPKPQVLRTSALWTSSSKA